MRRHPFTPLSVSPLLVLLLLVVTGCAAGQPSPARDDDSVGRGPGKAIAASRPSTGPSSSVDDAGLHGLLAWLAERGVGVEYAVSGGRVVALRFDADKTAGVSELVGSMPALPSVEEIYFW